MNKIHETAIIGENVKLGKDVEILPYCVIDGDVEIGDGAKIGPHARITGWVKIGVNAKIFSFAAIGEPPQDYSFDGTPGLVEIGNDVTLREGVTIHTPVGGNKGCTTTVGDNVFLMAYAHVAHNAKVGNHTTIANGTLLAGYVEVGDHVFLSGNIGVHQFCKIGSYCIVGAVAKINQDVPPFMMVDGNPGTVRGLNVIGLRRNGFNQAERSKLKEAYKLLYSGISIKEACNQMEEKLGDDERVMMMVDFIRASKRGVVSSHGKK